MSGAEVGITITVSQSELKTLISNLKTTDTTAKSSKGGLSQFASGMVDSLDKATKLTKTLRTVHLAMRLIGDAVRPVFAQLQEGLAFRFDDDAIMVSIRKVEQSMAQMRNGFMSLFAPLAVGISAALAGVSPQVTKFFKDHDTELKIGLIESFRTLSQVVTTVGYVMMYTASNVIGGWGELRSFIADVMYAAFAKLKSAGAAFWESMAAGASALHLDEKAAAFGEIAKQLREDSKDYQKQSDQAMAATARVVNQTKEFQAGLAAVYNQAKDAENKAADVALKNLAARTHVSDQTKEQFAQAMARSDVRLKREQAAADYIKSIRDQAAAQDDARLKTETAQAAERAKDLSEMIDKAAMSGNLDQALDLWRKFEAERDRLTDDSAKAIEKKLKETVGTGLEAKLSLDIKDGGVGGAIGQVHALIAAWSDYAAVRDVVGAKDAEGMKKAQKQVHDYEEQISTGLSVSMVSSFTDIIKGTMTVGQAFAAMAEMILQSIAQIITKELILKGIQIVGMALGFSEGGMVPGYADGGFITGGTPGKDSVPAMLTPGEFVIPEPIVRRIRNGSTPTNAGHFSDGGLVMNGSGATHDRAPQNITVIQPSLHFFAPVNRTGLDRMYRDVIIPVQNRFARFGVRKDPT